MKLTRVSSSLRFNCFYSTQPTNTTTTTTTTTSSLNNKNESKLSNSIHKLQSSFQEPLVGLSPPLVENPQKSSPPHPIPSTEPGSSSNNNNPSTSLTTRTTTSEFKVLPTHPFHTHQFIKKLRNSHFSHHSSTAILSHVENCLKLSEKRWLLTGPNGGIVSKSYVEGQAYLYNAALSELRTEVQVKARNDSIVLKSASNSIQREIENLHQKLKEDIGSLQTGLALEVNTRKEESSEAQKTLELAIQELTSKFTILVSEVRTEIETRKWVTTRRCVVAIASLGLCVILFTALDSNPHPPTPTPALPSSLPPSSNPSALDPGLLPLSHRPNSPHNLPSLRTVEDLGIRADLDHFESE